MPLVTGVETSFVEGFVQANGSALLMQASAFRQAMDEEPALRNQLLRYLEAMTAQITQTAACMRDLLLDVLQVTDSVGESMLYAVTVPDGMDR